MTKAAPLRNESFAPAELADLLRLAKRALRADDATRARLQQGGVNIVPSNFYSDIPSVADIEQSFEFKGDGAPYKSPRVFDPERLAAFLAEIDGYAEEFAPVREGSREDPAGFFWENPAFSFSDAMAYYCVLRHVKPARVIEIGSGYSTLVALQALERNGRGEIVSVEPFPMPWLEKLEDRLTLVRERVQDLEVAFFNDRLADGDVLFIDSTHTVKAGSDCLHIYLRVLPELTADLTVHVHDIFLPFPMPRQQFDRHIYWTEQYLFYAFLLDNPRARVVYGSRYNHAFARADLDRFMRGRWPSGGASMWFELKGASAV